MKKVAVIIEGNLNNRKGALNAALNRTIHLKKIMNCQIDVYCIETKRNAIMSFFQQKKIVPQEKNKVVDGLSIRLLNHKLSILDYILCFKLHYKEIFFRNDFFKYVPLFKDYDLILTHSLRSSRLAERISKKYNIPFYATWHGSDINIWPYTSASARKDTIDVLNNAKGNFFVSQALLNRACDLSVSSKKYVLYNGVDDRFVLYSDEKKLELRKEYVCENEKVVAFVGNLIPVKNALLLPSIFECVKKLFSQKICFWIVGDGKNRDEIESLIQEKSLNVRMFGDVSYDLMPGIMNCIDVLVLPSKNEGLPLVTVEAIKCGANVVGSDVGGIGEVLGVENVFDLNESFIEKISQRIVSLLNEKQNQQLSNIFSWKNTAMKELSIYENDEVC